MTFALLPEDAGRIRGWLVVYRVSAAITGVLLLLLFVVTILDWGFGLQIASGGTLGAISFVPADLIETTHATNLSTLFLIVHGWFYVAYLLIDFILWRLTRYSFLYFLFVALGGIIPFISFWFEWRVPRDIERAVAEAEAGVAGDEVAA